MSAKCCFGDTDVIGCHCSGSFDPLCRCCGASSPDTLLVLPLLYILFQSLFELCSYSPMSNPCTRMLLGNLKCRYFCRVCFPAWLVAALFKSITRSLCCRDSHRACQVACARQILFFAPVCFCRRMRRPNRNILATDEDSIQAH